MEVSSSLGTIHCVPQEKMFGRDDWILASFFLCDFMDLNSIWVHKHTKKELGQYPAILTSRLVNNPVITFFCSSGELPTGLVISVFFITHVAANLVPNVTAELYFVMQLLTARGIVSEQQQDGENGKEKTIYYFLLLII